MKTLPAPPVTGNTEWERFDNGVEMLLKSPKLAFIKQEKKLKRRRKKKAATKPDLDDVGRSSLLLPLRDPSDYAHDQGRQVERHLRFQDIARMGEEPCDA